MISFNLVEIYFWITYELDLILLEVFQMQINFHPI